jgi:rhamnose transport system permease protein
MLARFKFLRSWEAFLLLILVGVVIVNVNLSPFYLSLSNQINLFNLSIEKIIVVLIMAMIIINAEIDLSVASVMGLAGCTLAFLHEKEVALELAILVSLLVGVAAGVFNGLWIAYGGLSSLVVTLAGLIMYRGIARILLEDRSIGEFPEWFERLGQQAVLGPFPLALILFAAMFIVAFVVLQYSGFGRHIYVIGDNAEVARYSGVNVRRVKMILFSMSGLISALAGIMLAARLGSVRGNTAQGFELDIITIVLMGGVSIFGGQGTLSGVGLSILIILSLRNGMSLYNQSGNVQTGVIGALLIFSVLIPQLARWVRALLEKRTSTGQASMRGGDI